MAGHRAWAALVAAALSVSLCLLPASTSAAAPRPPGHLAARAAIVVDTGSGEVLFAKRPHARRPIASTTKLMTALLTLERTHPSQVLAAPAYHGLSAESTVGLRRGERLTVHDLLLALLLPSANDAAADLARGVAGSQAAFVRAMNARAVALGLRDTHYSNPVGLDAGANYSSAADLATLARRLMTVPGFRAIVDRPKAVLRSGAHRRVVVNRNDLVRRYRFVNGVKTGHTNRAGFVLVGAAAAHGVEVVSAVLGEPSIAARDGDSLALLRYGLGQLRRVRAVSAGRPLASAAVRYRGGERVALVSTRTVDVTARRGERPAVRVSAPAELEGPLPRGRRVGSASVAVGGRVVATAAVLTAAPVRGAGALRRLTSGLGPVLTWVLVGAIVVAVLLAAALVRRVGLPRMRAPSGER